MEMLGMRELTASDEPALRTLLQRVYGETYSYRQLYEPGEIARLVESGRVALWGDFSSEVELASHTGFLFKDPRADYVESGMSLRSPGAQPLTTDAEVWRRLFAWLDGRFVYMHQNTTTYHPLAQRYAERHMRAVPTGFIIDYAIGERLTGLTIPAGPMHALSMTTLLGATHPQPRLPVPAGPWAQYFTSIAHSLGMTPEAFDPTPRSMALDPTPIEHNRAIDLTRRSVARGAGDPIAARGTRTDLVHVPLDDRAAALGPLHAAGFVPVGVRVHATRPHEAVLQHLAGDRLAYAREALRSVRLGANGAALVAIWGEACARAT